MKSLDKLMTHLSCCNECQNNPFGLCKYGYRLIAAVKSEEKANEFSFIPVDISSRPLVKMFLKRYDYRKTTEYVSR